MSGIDGEDRVGEVITFYSYKGGTNRSTALANVACLLAKKQTEGKGILMIDWDLEAPGLHHFFQDRFSGVATESKSIGRPFDEVPGLIDLFLTFAQKTPNGPPETDEEASERAMHCLESVQFENYLISTSIPNLSLMKAGRFDLKYSSRVNKFDWKGLYNRSPMLFQLLAAHLTEKYRYVLIDSRTGITDVSGICTALMPQKLIAVFTPNQQSLTGVIGQVEWSNEYRRKSADLRPLLAFPLPSRIDISEPRLRDAWRLGDQAAGIAGYQPLFEKLFKKVYDLSDCDLSRYFDKIQVLHVPAYSYGEKIAALIEQTEGPGALLPIYRELCERINNGSTPWSSTSQAEREAKLAEVEAQADESSRREKAQKEVAFKAKRFAKLSTGVAACLGLLVGVTIWLWQKSYTIDQATLKVKSFFGSIHIAPKMVEIPGGTFKMGNVEHQGASRGHLVTIKKPFALGIYEVTFDEYDRFAIAEGRLLPSDQGWGRGDRPVTNVSWDEANAYAAWLSKATRKRYRLPSESEWEYAARGTKQDIWAGTSTQKQLADYAVYGANHMEPVGSKKSNRLGLFDLSGNVWEWAEDCWHEDYTDAPTDGSAWLESNGGDCAKRVIRGGSWNDTPEFLRASYRFRDPTANRDGHLGFRLAQDLEP